MFYTPTWRRWQLQLQMTKSFETQKTMGMQQEGESDELKRVFLEGNPILLVRHVLLAHLSAQCQCNPP